MSGNLSGAFDVGLPETIADSRVELEAMTESQVGRREVGLPAQELEEEAFFDHPIPPATETWNEHIADLRRRLADLDAGDPGMSVAEAFASIRAELGWINPATGKQA